MSIILSYNLVLKKNHISSNGVEIALCIVLELFMATGSKFKRMGQMRKIAIMTHKSVDNKVSILTITASRQQLP